MARKLGEPIVFGSVESFDVLIADARRMVARLEAMQWEAGYGDDVDLTDPEVWDDFGIDYERDPVIPVPWSDERWSVAELSRQISYYQLRITGLGYRRDSAEQSRTLIYAGGAGMPHWWVDPDKLDEHRERLDWGTI